MKSTLSELLSLLRREKGFSQRRAAADLNVSQALLSHYENGAREPKLEFIVRVCDYYGVTADYILGRSEDRGGGAARITEALGGIVDEFRELKLTENLILDKIRQLANNDS